MTTVLAMIAAALAVAWSWPAHPSPAHEQAAPEPADERGWLLRLRPLWALLAGSAGATFVSGRPGLVVGSGLAIAAWVYIGHAEPAGVRRRRVAAERDLPGLVHLLAAALETGCATGEAARIVCSAFPGPAADLLEPVPTKLALGVDPVTAWQSLLDHPPVAPLGRVMVRAHRSGAAVVAEVDRLADELAQRERLDVEERARSVGVKAAVPLGLCLLPSFVLIGIVPLVASLMGSLAW
jgi:Flp pilus assembly protein TadB